MTILLATKNKKKIEEFKKILNNDVLSLEDVDVEEPEENGKTFEENSIIKARYYGEKMKMSAIADDSGFCVDALNNFPSIYSARLNNGNKDYLNTFNFLKLLIEYNDIKDYSAHFVCNITFYDYDKKTINSFEGVCKGHVDFNFKVDNGFGYDPIFIPDGYNKSFAELTIEEKNKISHRGYAMAKFIKWYKFNY